MKETSCVLATRSQFEHTAGIAALPRLQPMSRVLMGHPQFFRVAYAINAHMRDAKGDLKVVDPQLALDQWNELRRSYERLGYPVAVLTPHPNLPDQVFTANPALIDPGRGDGGLVIPSRMRHPERAPEVDLLLGQLPVSLRRLAPPPEVGCFEGHGDLLWHPTRRLLLAGFGPRTDHGALEWVGSSLRVPVCSLELRDPRFYHLDTCLSVLNERQALYVPEAFTQDGRDLLAALFPDLIGTPLEEAVVAMACNAHSPDGRSVLLDREAVRTAEILRRAGFVPIPVGTSEFRKAGGSVFCMKLMLP